MCGRFDRNDIPRLLASIEWTDAVFNRSEADNSYNVSPGSYRPVLHHIDDALFLDDLHWGYRASWAEAAGKIPVTINDRGNTSAENRLTNDPRRARPARDH